MNQANQMNQMIEKLPEPFAKLKMAARVIVCFSDWPMIESIQGE